MALSVACGPAPSTLTPQTRTTQGAAIINGEQSEDGSYPSVGALLINVTSDFGSFGSMLCTGTLIAPDTVLLAAHCLESGFDDFGEATYYFSFAEDVSNFGTESTELPEDTYEVRGTVGHEEFDMQAMAPEQSGGGLQGDFTLGVDTEYYDVAVAFLEEPVTGVTPAVPMEKDDTLAVDDPVEIVGYGQREPGSGGMFQPVDAGIKYEAESFINEIGETEMQIGDNPEDGTPQKCKGDSGGPSFKRVSDGKDPALRVVGITSHAYDDELCNKGGVDTRVDAYLEWITTQMEDACSDGTRPACPETGSVGFSLPQAPEPPDNDNNNGGDGSDADAPPATDASGGGSDAMAATGGCQQASPQALSGAWMMLGLLSLRLFLSNRRRR